MASVNPSRWSAPQWVKDFYGKFPLVTLDQPELLPWKKLAGALPYNPPYCLWIDSPLPMDSSPIWRPWAASCPASLRAQLLFLLRGIAVRSRTWTNEATVPGGKLPVLHLLKENRFVDADNIREWLDKTHPQTGPTAQWHGLPDQPAYDSALAAAQLILSSLLPAYLASLPAKPQDISLLLANPPPLAAGLTTPLPASITGNDRSLNNDDVIEGGIEALEALRSVVGGSETGPWALCAASPTPLDALLASHIYCIYSLPTSSALRQKLEECHGLESYVSHVLDVASKSIQ